MNPSGGPGIDHILGLPLSSEENMPLVSRWTLVAVATALALLSSCGSGTAGLVAGGGDDGDPNTPGAMSAFTLDNPKVSPTQIEFVLSDPEADPATVELRYQIGGAPAQRLTHISGLSANPTALATSAQGIAYGVQWDFSAETDLPDDGSYVAGIRVFGNVAGGIQEIQIGANAAATGLGNDPPVVTDADVPSVEVDGIVGVSFSVSDSSDDIVDVRVEYDVIGDAPDAGWRLARPALLDVTPPLAFEGVLARSTGSDFEFFWDTDVDLGDLENDVRLRFTAIDSEVEGAPFTTASLHVDNNAAPIAQLDSGPIVLNPDERRGIPIPFRVIDEEADLVEVIFQWRREGETFPSLPSDSASLDAILADPAQRRAHRICTPYPRYASGRVVPIDATHVRLPELAGGENWILAASLEGHTLEVMRPSAVISGVAASWDANPFDSPIAALPLGDGRTALVLDQPRAGRLREIELATGSVVREIARLGSGIPSAMTFERGGEKSVLVAVDDAGAWHIEHVELASGVVSEIVVPNGGEPGPVRGIASLGSDAVVVTVGSSLVVVDFRDRLAPLLATIFSGLAAPWGVVVDPLGTNRVYVAEHGANQVLAVALDSHSVTPLVVSAASPSTLEQPTALALERGGTRLLALTSPPGGSSRITALDLGAAGGNVAYPASDAYASPITSLATGPDGLRVATQSSIDELLVGGGLEQSRGIESYAASSQELTVTSGFDPEPAPGQLVRIASHEQVRGGPGGSVGSFVWDSADAAFGAILFRVTARDDELGPSEEGTASKTVRSTLDVPPHLVGESPITAGAHSVAADLDRDGDVDLAVSNGLILADDPTSLLVFFQTSPGVFSSQPLVLDGAGGRATAADVNGDGALDLLAASDDRLAIFFQTSPGEFAVPPVLVGDPSVRTVLCVAAADLDGDGDLDLVSSNLHSNNLTVFFQTPDGDFAKPPLVLGGPSITPLPSFVAAADIDVDGRVDLVCASYDQDVSNLNVFFQTSPGRFDTPLVLGGLQVTSRPMSASMADLDGDGDLDIATANLGTHPVVDRGDVTVFFQSSARVFSQDPLVLSDTALDSTSGVIAADLDGDDDLDLVAPTPVNTCVFFQSSPGNFASRPLVLSEGDSRDATVADVEGDGDVDIIATHAFEVRLFLQTSPGNFGVGANPLVLGGSQLTLSPRALAAADLNGDGRADLVSANMVGGNLTVFFQDSPGSFASDTVVVGGPSITGDTWSLAAGDLDGDGDADLVTTDASKGQLSVYFQSSAGSFEPMPLTLGNPSVTAFPYSVAAADIDGDGAVDVISANLNSNNVTVFRQEARGRFTASPLILGGPSITNAPVSFAIADLDEDGDVDIACACVGNAFPDPDNGGLFVFFQTSTGRFASPPAQIGTGSTSAVTAADLDGDGDLDLAAVQRGEPCVFFQTTVGGFSRDSLVLGTFTDSSSIAASDIDRDCDLDLVFANTDPYNRLTVFFQSSPGRFAAQPYAVGDASITLGSVCVLATDLDGDGDPDLVSANEFGNDLTILFGGR